MLHLLPVFYLQSSFPSPPLILHLSHFHPIPYLSPDLHRISSPPSPLSRASLQHPRRPFSRRIFVRVRVISRSLLRSFYDVLLLFLLLSSGSSACSSLCNPRMIHLYAITRNNQSLIFWGGQSTSCCNYLINASVPYDRFPPVFARPIALRPKSRPGSSRSPTPFVFLSISNR